MHERWIRSRIRLDEALLGRFEAWYEIPIDADTWRTSLEIMIAYGLQSLDAVQVATARRLGLTHLATTDDHFTRASGEFAILLIQDGRNS